MYIAEKKLRTHIVSRFNCVLHLSVFFVLRMEDLKLVRFNMGLRLVNCCECIQVMMALVKKVTEQHR